MFGRALLALEPGLEPDVEQRQKFVETLRGVMDGGESSRPMKEEESSLRPVSGRMGQEGGGDT